MSRATEAAAIHRAALEAILAVTGSARAAVLLFDAAGVMRFVAASGISDEYRRAVTGHTPWRPGEPAPEPLAFGDVASEPSLASVRDALAAEAIAAALMVPLVTANGTIGKFMVYYDAPRAFGAEARDEIERVSMIAAYTAFALDRHRFVEALAASEARHRTLVDQLDQIVFSLDGAGVVQFVNAAWTARTGGAREAIVGRPLSEVLAPASRGVLDEYLTAQLAPAGGAAASERCEVELPTADRGVRTFEISAGVFGDGSDEKVQISGSMRDVTDARRAAEVARREAAKLAEQQRLESLGLLAGGIAHDFNNLLVGVLSNASLALTDARVQPDQREMLEEIVASARRAAELTQQMLAFAGKASIAPALVDVAQVVDEAASVFASSRAPSAKLRLRVAADVPPVRGDGRQLRQLAVHLLLNAADALEERPGEIELSLERVEVDARLLATAHHGRELPAGAYVALSIRDAGVGIDDSIVARIFEPFFTTKAQGRGLGLAAALGIVRSHCGAIFVDSARGRGTTMRVLLPVAATPGGLHERAPRARSTSRRRVLLVDDEPMVRSVIERALARLDVTVTSAADGGEGLAALEREAANFDLVLLDLTLPVLSGLELMAVIRERWSTLPVVLMSGYSALDVDFASCGARAFLQKPFTVDELGRVTEQVLGARARTGS